MVTKSLTTILKLQHLIQGDRRRRRLSPSRMRNRVAVSHYTVPKVCSELKKNDYVILKKAPCKIVEITFAKTGKHGHMKAHIIGIDIFNGKKYEDIIPGSHNVDVPIVKREEYQLIDIDENYNCSLMLINGELLENIEITTEELKEKIKEDFNNIEEKALNKNIIVSTLSAMGIQMIVSYKSISY